MIVDNKYMTEVRRKIKVLFCSFVFLFFSVSLIAQREYDHDVTLGYGLVTSNQIFDVAADVLTSAILPGGYATFNSQYPGGFSVSYKNSVSDRWNVGVIGSFDLVTKDVFTANQKKGDLNRKFYTIAGEVDFRYFKREIFQMYSLVGLGYTIFRDRYMPVVEEKASKDTSGYVNFHVSLLGIRLGKELAFYTEVGFGYKGILNFGLSYQF